MDDKPCVIDGSGTQRRDFIFVSDVVEANMRAAEAPKAAGTVINVGCGTDNSIKDIVDELRTLMKKKIGSEYGPRRAGDVDRTIADIGLMKDLLKVFPRVGFHEGLERTVEWFRKKKTETSNQ
jgi:nucleoside-diphosphate-sugar epimerase